MSPRGFLFRIFCENEVGKSSFLFYSYIFFCDEFFSNSYVRYSRTTRNETNRQSRWAKMKFKVKVRNTLVTKQCRCQSCKWPLPSYKRSQSQNQYLKVKISIQKCLLLSARQYHLHYTSPSPSLRYNFATSLQRDSQVKKFLETQISTRSEFTKFFVPRFPHLTVHLSNLQPSRQPINPLSP